MLTVLLNALLLWYVWRQSDFAIFSVQLYVLIVFTLPVMCAVWCGVCDLVLCGCEHCNVLRCACGVVCTRGVVHAGHVVCIVLIVTLCYVFIVLNVVSVRPEQW